MVFKAIYCHPYCFIRKSHMETELPKALESVAQKLSNDYQIVVRDDWIEIIGYSKGETAYDPKLEHLMGGVNDFGFPIRSGHL